MEGNLKRKGISKSPGTSPSAKKCHLDENDENSGDENDPDVLRKKMSDLTKEISEKEDILRKLNLVKLYKTKEEYSNLPQLKQKWLNCCQQAIQDLHDHLPEPKPTMSEFMGHLNIKPSLLNYNEEDETFED